MQYLKLIGISAALFLGVADTAYGQSMDEIVVTGSRIEAFEDFDENESAGPGLFLEKKGDFLLLEVQIENDSRELTTRLQEIDTAIEQFIEAVGDHPKITLSILDESDFVRPLSKDNFRDGIRAGVRPDTSVATLQVKTAIPDEVKDSYKLATMLSEFVDGIEENDRTKIQTYGNISVSVVDPYQYRTGVIKLVVGEINEITDSLGPEYRAVIKGLDKDLKWVRSGDLNLAFYLPYSYNIIPDNLTTYR